MKSSIALVAIYIAVVQSCNVEKVEGINEGVWQFVFDRYSNTYLITSNNDGTYSFYKLDSNNHIVVNKSLSGVPHLTINTLGDVYVFDSELKKDDDATGVMVYIWLLKTNNNTMEQISYFIYPSGSRSTCSIYNVEFIDEEDIIYLNDENGVNFARSPENTFLALDNLEGYNFCYHAIDGDGNVYLSLRQNRRVVVIAKESKRLPMLSAETIIESDDDIYSLYLMRGYQNFAFAAWASGRNRMTVVKLSKNSTELLFSKYYTVIGCQIVAKHVFILTVQSIQVNEFSAFIFTPDKKFTRFDSQIWESVQGGYIYPSATNTAGEIFLDTGIANSGDWNNSIVIIKPRESKYEISDFSFEVPISSLLVDVDDNLWIVSDGLWFMPKNSKNVSLISDSPINAFLVTRYSYNFDYMFQKPATRDIYIGAETGLYICKN